jgi:hypothetical protein
VSAWARPEKAAAADRMDRATMRVAFMISSSKSKVEQEVSGIAGFLQAFGPEVFGVFGITMDSTVGILA